MTRLVLSLLLVGSVAPLSSAARCLSYEPTVVTLKGEFSVQVVPGPPGYTSMARGDLPETVVILELDEAVCVLSKTGTIHNTRSHPRIRQVQLEVSPVEVRKYEGKRIHATGSLFGAHTGHHRTPVVLRVEGIGPARPASK